MPPFRLFCDHSHVVDTSDVQRCVHVTLCARSGSSPRPVFWTCLAGDREVEAASMPWDLWVHSHSSLFICWACSLVSKWKCKSWTSVKLSSTKHSTEDGLSHLRASPTGLPSKLSSGHMSRCSPGKSPCILELDVLYVISCGLLPNIYSESVCKLLFIPWHLGILLAG